MQKKFRLYMFQFSLALLIGLGVLIPGSQQNQQLLAQVPTSSATPASPYGKILYDKGGITVMDPDGSNKVNLSHGDYEQFPSWSPDGQWVVFQDKRQYPRQIYLMGADGSHETKLTDGPQDEEPRFSPDGQKILFARGDYSFNFVLYTMNPDGSNAKAVGNVSGWSANWSPDGKQIVYEDQTQGNFQIFVVNADGSGKRQLTQTKMDSVAPVWSPNGQQIAFAAGTTVNQKQIYVMNLDGSHPVNLSNNQFNEGEPTWSPDGNFIAYTSEREKSTTYICVMNADGSKQHLIGDKYSDQPSWSGPGAVFPNSDALPVATVTSSN